MATNEFFSIERSYIEALQRRIVHTLGANANLPPFNYYSALVAELLAWDALDSTTREGGFALTEEQRFSAKETFVLLRELPAPKEADDVVPWNLRIASLAVLADLPQEAQKLTLSVELANSVAPEDEWLEFVRQSVWGGWLGLIRQQTKRDVMHTQGVLKTLREKQKAFEGSYLARLAQADSDAARSAAIELIGLYFMGTAAERLSEYLLDGMAEGGADIEAQLDMLFDRVLSALDRCAGVANLDIALLLRPTAHCLANASLRAATRGANQLVRKFADSLISRPHRPLFQLLPPQRKALREQNLSTNVHRSVVVNFPTSSGKTLLAQFGILQALNDLGTERGWVAYVAPTRALVNQVTNRLRKDFAPLGKRVERLSPALEFDTTEMSALNPVNVAVDGPPVDILVCTPEKLDLLIRRDELHAHLGQLAMVVVDEAHGIGGKDSRALKVELLLSIVNREHTDVRFLMLTPFISNAKRVAQWLDRENHRDYSIDADWAPNDRIIGIATPPVGQPGKKVDHYFFQPIATPKATLHLEGLLQLNGVNTVPGYTASKLKNSTTLLSSAVAQQLSGRGASVVLCRTVGQSWDCAAELAKNSWPELPGADDRSAVARFAAAELGSSTPLQALLGNGIGVHNGGLPEELAAAMEWLFENKQLHALCATTTLAQGVNFPIANLVLTSIYPVGLYGEPMSYADFWNIAGRVGRVDQDAVGLVVLAACDDASRDKCEAFLKRSMTELVSCLVGMVEDLTSLANGLNLEELTYKKEWSNFSQFIAHTLRQVGASKFADQVELVLRGTFGYQSLRETESQLASGLLRATRAYAARLAKDMGCVALVDSTGFSFESVRRALAELSDISGADLLDPTRLFSGRSQTLKDVMGVMLKIPEIKKDLIEEEARGNGGRVASMVADWVNGVSFEALSKKYFQSGGDDGDALAKCVRGFKRLAMNSAWGMSSILSMKVGQAIEQLSPEHRKEVLNIPSMILYGVRTTEQIALRSAGVPRNAAIALSSHFTAAPTPYATRQALRDGGRDLWTRALGAVGSDYHRVWQMIEG